MTIPLKKNINSSVEFLKRQLIDRYVLLMSIVLFLYSCVFYFLLGDKVFAACTFAYFVILSYTFLVIRSKDYNIKVLVHLHLTYAPLFAAFVMLYFWKYSAATSMWLLPVPLGAYIFLEKKYVYIYSAYILVIIITVSILTKFFNFDYFSLNNVNHITISDTFVCIVNLMVLFLLLFYNEKIRKAEFEKSHNKVQPAESRNIEPVTAIEPINDPAEKAPQAATLVQNEKYAGLFNDIQRVVEQECHFKEVDFTISKLSYILNVNNLYISKTIKLNGYSNFNHYLNVCRVDHVKKIIMEDDLNKITLMYIYTASGFSNQSTFNRVFKQIEGITPSEYISGRIKNTN